MVAHITKWPLPEGKGPFGNKHWVAALPYRIAATIVSSR